MQPSFEVERVQALRLARKVRLELHGIASQVAT